MITGKRGKIWISVSDSHLQVPQLLFWELPTEAYAKRAELAFATVKQEPACGIGTVQGCSTAQNSV